MKKKTVLLLLSALIISGTMNLNVYAAKNSRQARTPKTLTRQTVPVSSYSLSITPEQAVQAAYQLYQQGGLGAQDAYNRVCAILNSLIADPNNYAAIVQKDLLSMQSGFAAQTGVKTNFSMDDTVKLARSLYEAPGLDSIAALKRVQTKMAEFKANPSAVSQIVGQDLKFVNQRDHLQTSLTAAQIAQSSYAALLKAGFTSEEAFQMVQTNLPALSALVGQ